MLAKLVAILMIVWFYQTAKKIGENGVKWGITGLIGYYLAVGITHLTVAKPLLDFFLNRSMWLSLLFGHLPVFVGIAAAYFIRKKFLLGDGKKLGE
ncbi:MAG: hypothetical protein ACU833_00480 [Gammaproteobacteria bacterium]